MELFPYRKGWFINPSHPPYKNGNDYLKKSRGHLTGRIKMPEIKYGGGPMEQDLTIEHGYHTTLESHTIKKKGARVSTRYINRLEIWVNIHNSLHPSIVQVENCLTISYCRYNKFKKYTEDLVS